MFALVIDGVVRHCWDVDKLPPIHADLAKYYIKVPAGVSVSNGDLHDGRVFSRPPTVEPTYDELRRREYPAMGEQLDTIWKQFNQMRLDGIPMIQQADDMLGQILAVKNKHPKPEA